MILLPWYMYWLSISAAMFLGFVLCALLSVGGMVSIREDEGQKDDYVDWSKIPDGYDWVAIDPWDEDNSGRDRIVRVYETEPKYKEQKGWLYSNWKSYYIHEIGIDPLVSLPPWRESLRRRPASV